MKSRAWFAIALVLIVIHTVSALASPLKLYKFVTRYYKISPIGEVEGTTDIKLEVRGSGYLNIEDVVIFIDPSSITLVGDTPPPNDIDEDQLLTRVKWNVPVEKNLVIHYQAKSSTKAMDGYCLVSVNSEPVNFTRIRGTFLIKAKENDLVNITYVLYNSMPLFVRVNGTLFRVVLPAVITLGFDESKLIVKDVSPEPNASSKLGSSKVFVWFRLLKDNFTISILVKVKSLGPWSEIKVEPLNVKIDFSVDKYIEKIDASIKELREQLNEIEEYIKSFNNTLALYKSYSANVENTTGELRGLGELLKNNVSKAFMSQYYSANYYKSKLERLSKQTSLIKENMSQVIALLDEIERGLVKAREYTKNTVNLLNTTKRLIKLLGRYNVSDSLTSTYLSLIETLISSVGSSKSSASFIATFIDSLKDFLRTSYEKVEEMENLFRKLTAEIEAYAKLQYDLSTSLYHLGEALVNMSQLMEQIASEFNNVVKVYEEKINSLEEKRSYLEDVIDDLTEVKMGLVALKYLRVIESCVFTEACINVLYNQTAVIFELSELDEREEALIYEALEVDIGGFHITGINIEVMSRSITPKKGVEVPAELNIGYIFTFVMSVILILIIIIMRRFKRKAHEELLRKIDELVRLIEKELSKS